MRLAVSAGGSAREHRLRADAARRPRARTRGRTGAARDAYRGALRDVPGYPQALTGLARLDAASGDLEGPPLACVAPTNRLPLTTRAHAAGRGRAGGSGTRARPRRRPGRRARAARACSGGTARAPDAEAVLFEANHGSPAASRAARPARVARRAEHPLGRRARMGAHARGPAARAGCAGRGARCGRARATRCSGCTRASRRGGLGLGCEARAASRDRSGGSSGAVARGRSAAPGGASR